MNKWHRYIIVALFSIPLFLPIHASFFKNVTAWLFGGESTRVFHEISCYPDVTIMVDNNGPISVQGWSLAAVAAEIIVQGPQESLRDVTPSYSCSPTTCPREVHFYGRNLESQPLVEMTYNLMVPRQATLIIKTKSGGVSIKQCYGSISVVTEQGNVVIHDISHSVFVHAQHSIQAFVRSLQGRHSLELISQEREISLTLPAHCHASLFAKTTTGSITSEQKVLVSSHTMKLNAESWRQARRNIRGMLGSGKGPMITLQAYGNISLLEK
jgi:hypothetical protein